MKVFFLHLVTVQSSQMFVASCEESLWTLSRMLLKSIILIKHLQMWSLIFLFFSQIFDSEGKLVEDTTMQALEVFCTCWFTFEVRMSVQSVCYGHVRVCAAVWKQRTLSMFSVSEVVTRLLLAPNRKKFFHHPLNIIDMVSVVPIYITLLFDLTVGSESELGDLGRLIQVQNVSSVSAQKLFVSNHRVKISHVWPETHGASVLRAHSASFC